ncbi:putative bifunctional diguanylate cyclase/phosphodiesterase [Oleispirillum naphthae]|uniref:putative bifunctional diguanylate cyclase/phosphodiesterase n=1 Tax=Oleispirillum naphthae TaxID=2838853 RepID=UPI0030823AAA
MPKRSRTIDWQELQGRIIGLGEESLKKSHYPELQERLRELERFRALFDLSSDIVLILDIAAERIADWNRTAQDALGHAAPPPLSAIGAEEVLAFLREDHSGCAQRPEMCSRTIVTAFRRADGSRFPVEIAVSLRAGDAERLAIAVGRDITERMRTEQRLRQAAAVFDNAVEGIMVLDAARDIVAVSPAFVQVTGYAADEVVGRPVAVMRSLRHGDAFYAALWAAVEQTGQWQGEMWSLRKSGEALPMWMAIGTVRDDAGAPAQYVCVFSDISRLKESERRLEHLTHHDPLTQLPNRLMLGAALERALTRARRTGRALALLFIDIDRFKTINDTLGHQTGDLLLQALASRIANSVRAADLVAHMSGDEFAVLLEDVSSADDAARVARKVVQACTEPFDLDGFEAFVTLSIGITLFPEHGQSVTALLRNCDSAVHHAKSEGGNRFRIYTRELTKIAFKNLRIETSLRRAIDAGEIELFYQPQFRLADDALCGAEALARWRHPKRGIIPPDAFIPRAEKTGLIVPMGEHLLFDACRRVKTWLDAGLAAVPVAVNISGVQITSSPIVETVAAALADSGLPPELLKLEITESFAMRGTQGSIDRLHALRTLGVELAIDDFGTGYASLAYLRDLPVTIIKIDREFVHNVPDHRGDCAIIEAIVAMAHGLGLMVVAEGVETEAQKAFLARSGCDIMQGYLGGHPAPHREFERRLPRRTGPRG